jgi:hypothetical protein
VRALLVAAYAVCCACSAPASDPSPGGAAGHVAIGVADASSESDASGAVGIPVSEAGAMPDECPWPIAADAGTSSDPLCSGAFGSGGDCPPEPPAPGSPCQSPLQCAYWIDQYSLSLFACSGSSWSESVASCNDSCELFDAGAGVAVGGTCGTEQVGCGATTPAHPTQLELLRKALGELAWCCGASHEYRLGVRFAHGCATELYFGPPSVFDVEVRNCIAKSLAGKAIDCAATIDCAVTFSTTLQ